MWKGLNMGNYSIGIDLGGTKILTGITDKKNGEVISFIKKKTKKDKGAEKIIQKISSWKFSNKTIRNRWYRYRSCRADRPWKRNNNKCT